MIGYDLALADEYADAYRRGFRDGAREAPQVAGGLAALRTMRDAIHASLNAPLDRHTHGSDYAHRAGRADAYSDELIRHVPVTVDLATLHGCDLIGKPKLMQLALAQAKAIGAASVTYTRDCPHFQVRANGWEVVYRPEAGPDDLFDHPHVFVTGPACWVVKPAHDGALRYHFFYGTANEPQLARCLALFGVQPDH
ncbi:MAG: hypothetical protein ACRDJW_04645 [Thermomicrobiales bacterium]